MNQLFEVLVGSLDTACLYALLGVGFVIIYKSTRVINFLQGNFVYLGALIFFKLFTSFNSNFFIAAILTVACAAVAGALIFLVVMAPLSARGVLAMVMVTLIIGTAILSPIASMTFGSAERYFKVPLREAAYKLPGGAFITQAELVTLAVTIIFIGGIALFLRYSRFGTAMRAGAENGTLAEYIGVNITVAGAASWAIATVAAALAGIAFAARVPIDGSMINLGIYAFPAILIGGMDSVGGVSLGSIIFAVLQNASVTYISGSASDITAGVVMLAILAVRPFGLFGSPEYRRL